MGQTFCFTDDLKWICCVALPPNRRHLGSFLCTAKAVVIILTFLRIALYFFTLAWEKQHGSFFPSKVSFSQEIQFVCPGDLHLHEGNALKNEWFKLHLGQVERFSICLHSHCPKLGTFPKFLTPTAVSLIRYRNLSPLCRDANYVAAAAIINRVISGGSSVQFSTVRLLVETSIWDRSVWGWESQFSSESARMSNQRPVWRRDSAFLCLSCIHYSARPSCDGFTAEVTFILCYFTIFYIYFGSFCQGYCLTTVAPALF